jgi:hypothetical protein
MSDKSIAELEAQLRAAKQRKSEEDEARRKSVKPVYQFSLIPRPEERRYEKIIDSSIRVYRLEGKILNVDELAAAGWLKRDLESGGMSYLFNSLSGKIVMETGGGRLYVSDWNHTREQYLAVMDELSAFVVANPEGGDVTEIVENYQKSEKKYV